MEQPNSEAGETPTSFELVGRIASPIRRSTLETDHSDPEWQSLTDVLSWAFCCRLQIARLRQSFMSEFTSGQRLYTFQRATFMRTSFDEHALVIAAGNLAKAMERAPKFLRKILPKESLRVLQLLRNNYEHWEQMRAAFRKGGPEKADAALSITKEFPDAKPWTIALHLNGDIDLANVVLLKALNGDLRKLEASAHWRQRQLRKEGRHKATEEPRPIRKKNGLAAGEANSPNRGLKRTSDAAA